ncbi:MAG: GNAT family N-acetyltransferase [Polyangiaceae bacterium]
MIASRAGAAEDGAARAYSKNVISRDGKPLLIRALRSSDRQLLAAFFLQLSPQSVRYRVFAAKSTLTEKELTYLVELDFVAHVGLVAVVVESERERAIGVGRYCRVRSFHADEPSAAAEIALTVLDECQGQGVGTLLLEHLADIARTHGISEFEADVMVGNSKMMQLLQDSGFVMHKSLDDGVFHMSFSTSATDLFLKASRARELSA